MKVRAGKVWGFMLGLGMLALLPAEQTISQTLAGKELAGALQKGGYVILMRHASSPRERPTDEAANEDNLNKERQLDAQGRADAKAMGDAWRRLGISITEIMSSPTYRAVETLTAAGFALEEVQRSSGLSMANLSQENMTKAEWLRSKVAAAAAAGNKLIVTHGPNVAESYPDLQPGLDDGEALVFQPDGKGGAKLVARVKIKDWAGL